MPSPLVATGSRAPPTASMNPKRFGRTPRIRLTSRVPADGSIPTDSTTMSIGTSIGRPIVVSSPRTISRSPLAKHLGDDALDVLDVVLLLGYPVDLVLPVAVHPHVDVEDVDLAVGQQLADLDRLLGGDPAADLGAVLVADVPVALADALDETQPVRRLAGGGPHHLVLFEHRLQVRQRQHVRRTRSSRTSGSRAPGRSARTRSRR